MVNDFVFTIEALSKISLSDLKRLADYFELSYAKNIGKKHIVELIYGGQKYEKWYGAGLAEVPQMSVRIQRIKKSMEGE